MNNQKRRLRVLFSVIGLIAVALSVAMIFIAPGTFWNWALLLVALVFMYLARRTATQ